MRQGIGLRAGLTEMMTRYGTSDADADAAGSTKNSPASTTHQRSPAALARAAGATTCGPPSITHSVPALRSCEGAMCVATTLRPPPAPSAEVPATGAGSVTEETLPVVSGLPTTGGDDPAEASSGLVAPRKPKSSPVPPDMGAASLGSSLAG